jgi:phage tail-like protein
MPGRGTSEGRYLVEIDGVPAVRASEVNGIRFDHTEFKLYVGNDPMPLKGRGHFEVSDVTIRHAHALNGAGDDLFQWMRDFRNGDNVERRGMRFVVLDEDGQTPVATYELINCIPKQFEVDSHTGGGTNPSYFRFMVSAEDLEVL